MIPKVAEGINNVIAKFNETDEYVLYYHSGHKTLRVFRVTDGEMIADYRVPSNLTSLESTTNGKHVALGMVDGNVSILTIADPKKSRMDHYIRSLPSRQMMQAVITNGCRLQNLVKKRDCVEDFIKKGFHSKTLKNKSRTKSTSGNKTGEEIDPQPEHLTTNDKGIKDSSKAT